MVRRRRFLGRVATASTLAIAGCSNSSEPTTEEDTEENTEGGSDKEKVRDVIETNFQANENEEKNQLQSTLHPESEVYESTVEQSVQLWRTYNLEYNYTIQSIEIDGEVAEAELTQETIGNSENFRDNRLTATWEFRKYQGEWRLYDSTTQNIEYID